MADSALPWPRSSMRIAIGRSAALRALAAKSSNSARRTGAMSGAPETQNLDRRTFAARIDSVNVAGITVIGRRGGTTETLASHVVAAGLGSRALPSKATDAAALSRDRTGTRGVARSRTIATIHAAECGTLMDV
jgi:hypothetical protein